MRILFSVAMSPKHQPELSLELKTMRPGGYYWRLLGRELDDRAKLIQVVDCLIQEIKAHRTQAETMGIWPGDLKCASEGAELLMDGRAESLQCLIGVLVANLEAFRRCIRQHGEWPPIEFDAKDVARALLGYDPDSKVEVIDAEL